MRKIILAAATTAVLASSTAFAGPEDAFYIKGAVGWNKMEKILNSGDLDNTGGKLDSGKSDSAFLLGLGVGYYLMDNVRFDLALDHYFDPKMKFSIKDESSKGSIKITTKVNALTLNGYVDLFDVSVAKIFAGAGVGMSQVKMKSSYIQTHDDGSTETGSDSTKTRNNFTYALHLGASTEFAPGVNGDLSYSWRDFGKLAKDDKGNGPRLKGHNVVFGVRFDL